MPRIPPLLAGCIITGTIAAATGTAWILATGRLSPAGIVLGRLSHPRGGRPGSTPTPAGPAPTPLDHQQPPQTPTLRSTVNDRTNPVPPRLTTDQIRQILAAEKGDQNPDCFLCRTPVTTMKATVHYGMEEETRIVTLYPCEHRWSYNVNVAEQVQAEMRMEAATEATKPDSPDLAALDTVENQAWHTVWLEGNWKWLTSKMTEEGREYAADRVAAYSLHLSQWNAEPVHTEPEGLRWWRDDR